MKHKQNNGILSMSEKGINFPIKGIERGAKLPDEAHRSRHQVYEGHGKPPSLGSLEIRCALKRTRRMRYKEQGDELRDFPYSIIETARFCAR